MRAQSLGKVSNHLPNKTKHSEVASLEMDLDYSKKERNMSPILIPQNLLASQMSAYSGKMGENYIEKVI